MNKPEPLDVRDLENLHKSLKAAIDRKTFKEDELEVILPLHQKLANFLTAYHDLKENQ